MASVTVSLRKVRRRERAKSSNTPRSLENYGRFKTHDSSREATRRVAPRRSFFTGHSFFVRRHPAVHWRDRRGALLDLFGKYRDPQPVVPDLLRALRGDLCRHPHHLLSLHALRQAVGPDL